MVSVIQGGIKIDCREGWGLIPIARKTCRIFPPLTGYRNQLAIPLIMIVRVILLTGKFYFYSKEDKSFRKSKDCWKLEISKMVLLCKCGR